MAISKDKYDFFTFRLTYAKDINGQVVSGHDAHHALEYLKEVLLEGLEYQCSGMFGRLYTEQGVWHDNILLLPLRRNKLVAKYNDRESVVQTNGNGDAVTLQPEFEDSHPYCFVVFDLRKDTHVVAIQRNRDFGAFPDTVVTGLSSVLNSRLDKRGYCIAIEPMVQKRDFWIEVADRIHDGDKLKEMVFDFEKAAVDKEALEDLPEGVRNIVIELKNFGQSQLVMRYTKADQAQILKKEHDFVAMLSLCYLSRGEYMLKAEFANSGVYRSGTATRLRWVLGNDVRFEFMNSGVGLNGRFRLADWLDAAVSACSVQDLRMVRFSDEDCRRVREAYKASRALQMMQELTSRFSNDLETIKPKPEEFFILVFAVFDRIKRNEEIDDRYGIRTWCMLRDEIAAATKRAWGRDAGKEDRETMAGVVYATVMDCLLWVDAIRYDELHSVLFHNFSEYQKKIDVSEVNIHQGDLKGFINDSLLACHVLRELRDYLADSTNCYTREDGMPSRVEVKGEYKCLPDPNSPILPYVSQERDGETAIAYIREVLRGKVNLQTRDVRNTALGEVVVFLIKERYLNGKVPFKVLKAQFPDLVGGDEKTYNKHFQKHDVMRALRG